MKITNDTMTPDIYVLYRCPNCKAHKGILQRVKYPLKVDCVSCKLEYQRSVRMVPEKHWKVRNGTRQDMHDSFNET